MKSLTKRLLPVLLLLVMGAFLASVAAAAPTLTNGTFTVMGFEDDKLIIKLEKDTILSSIELSGNGQTIPVGSVSNLDNIMEMTADGFLYKTGRIACTFDLPDGFKAQKLVIKTKKGDEPVEFDVSGL